MGGHVISSPIRRLFAHLLDYFLTILVFEIATNVHFVAGLLLIIALIGLQLYYFSKGTTLGKKIFGMYVLHKRTEKNLGFWNMLIRETIGKWFSALILCLGYFWILIDDQNQGWHDKLVDSIVVQNITVVESTEEREQG